MPNLSVFTNNNLPIQMSRFQFAPKISAHQSSDIKAFVNRNKTPDLETFISLLDHSVAPRNPSSYFYKSQSVANIQPLLKILGRRCVFSESVQLMMAQQHSNAVHSFISQQNQQYQQVLISYLGLYPVIQSPAGVEVPSLFVNIPEYSGNPFWIISQNILSERVNSRSFADLKSNHAQIALVLAILAGNQYQILSILDLMLSFEWSSVVWTKLYAYYRYQLVSRILEIQKQDFRQSSERLLCLDTQYTLDQIQWEQIEAQIHLNNLDIINFSIVKSLVQSNTIDTIDLINKIREVSISPNTDEQALIKSAVYLYSKLPSQTLKQHILQFIRNSTLEEQILPLILSTNEEIVEFYLSAQSEGDPTRFDKFKSLQLKSEVAKRYLEQSNYNNKTLSTINHIVSPSQKVDYLVSYLPTIKSPEIQTALALLKSTLDQKHEIIDRIDYIEIYNNYNNIIKLLNPEWNQRNFVQLHKFLSNPGQDILGVKPPQYNKHLLIRAINNFFDNAVYLIETQTYHIKAPIFEKSKQVVIGLQSYIHDVLSEEEIIRSLNRGIYQVLIRDEGFINDIVIME